MKLSKEAQDALEVIRFKVEKQQYDLRGVEPNCLKVVCEELQFVFVNKKVRLDIACSGCIKTAMNVVKNYVDFHEPKTVRVANVPTKPANVVRVDVNDKLPTFEMTGEAEIVGVLLTDSPAHGVMGVTFSDSQTNLSNLSIEQLQEICKKEGIKYHHKSKESKLIELILAHEETN